MSKINIGSETYTKTALEKVCKAIVKKYVPGELLKGHDFEVAKWVLSQTKPDVACLPKLQISVMNRGEYNCFAWRKDSRCKWYDFSYRKLFKGNDDVEKAFRFEVQDFIRSFRKQQLSKPCNAHLKALAVKDNQSVHTDHVVPFHQILSDFLVPRGLTIYDVELVNHPHIESCKMLADRKLAEQWQTFHNAVAQLKLLSADENYAKANNTDIPLALYNIKLGKSAKCLPSVA